MIEKPRPLCVSVTPWAPRSNSAAPTVSSSSRMALVTADWEIASWIAACEIWPSSAAATKYLSWRSVIDMAGVI